MISILVIIETERQMKNTTNKPWISKLIFLLLRNFMLKIINKLKTKAEEVKIRDSIPYCCLEFLKKNFGIPPSYPKKGTFSPKK